jgi:AraC family L-rhamnose operon regulatory protein RhaS
MKTGASHFSLNKKEFVMTGACAVCLNEQDRIEFHHIREEEVKILWFKPTVINQIFTYELLNNPNRKLSQTENQDFFYITQFTHMTEETRKIQSLNTIDFTGMEYKLQIIQELLTKQNTYYWPCRSRSYLFEILFLLTRLNDDISPNQNILLYEGSSRFATDIIYYLQSSYHKKITIEKLTDLFHTNRTTLLNEFKKYTGQSINQYLIDLRLTMAATLLRDTELTADEISERTGFRDISYFSKVFKKKLAYTPSEYRRINKHEIY